MTTIDLHPEEMLDAARRGTLSRQGEADLRAHLARCSACRFSLTLPDDLRAETAPSSGDVALLTSMVRGAMTGEPRPHRVPATGLTVRRAAVALALLFVGGSAGAGVWANRDSIARRLAPTIVELPREAPRPAQRPRSRVVAPVVETIVIPARVVAPSRPVKRVVAAAAPVASAEELFSEANRARRAGNDALALRRYAELRRTWPGTREEITSRVVAADLMLSQGSPREALAGFDGYLGANPEGNLSEEALVGRAQALQRLGRADDERQAWLKLLRKHPDSVQGARARGRLAELR